MAPRRLLLAVVLAALQAGRLLAQSVDDPLAAIAGRWGVTGSHEVDCQTSAQVFAPSADRTRVDLATALGGTNRSARTLVIHAEANRVLMFIEGGKTANRSG